MRAAEVGFVTACGYRSAKSRPASARTLSDQLIGGEIARLHAENYGVHGVRKMHRLLKRQGWATGRHQTGRIIRSLGLRGIKRGKRVFTSKSDPAGIRQSLRRVAQLRLTKLHAKSNQGCQNRIASDNGRRKHMVRRRLPTSYLVHSHREMSRRWGGRLVHGLRDRIRQHQARGRRLDSRGRSSYYLESEGGIKKCPAELSRCR